MRRLPDSRAWFDRLFPSGLFVGLAILAFTVLTRASVFGDPNFQFDEPYYFLIGQRMQAGDLLYVDIWDRKPPGLYLLYSLFAAISQHFWIVHFAAAVSAGATALLIFRIALTISNRQGSVLAALCYLVLLPKFGGAGGQSPVFYNLLMAMAAWLIIRTACDADKSSQLGREIGAMACAGIALTIKQTTVFEAAFMGLWLVWNHRAAGMNWSALAIRAVTLVIAGALPTIAYFAWYAAHGSLDILWQSVAGSNLVREYDPEGNNALRVGILLGQIGLPLAAPVLAILLPRNGARRDRVFVFVAIWMVVALAAVAVFPNKFDHYMLPTLLPLSIVGAPFYGRRDFGLAVATVLIVAFLIAGKCFDFDYHRKSREEMEAVARIVRAGNAQTPLLVYGDPVFLYAMSHAKPPVALAFPAHLFDRSERDVSPYKTEVQLRQALLARPATVVIQLPLPSIRDNADLTALVEHYAKSCKDRRTMPLRNMYERYVVSVHSRCGT